MTEENKGSPVEPVIAGMGPQRKTSLRSMAAFNFLARFILVMTALTILYWLFFASDRYVAETSIIIQRTDMVSGPGFDLSTIISGASGINRPDQLLLREYLMSVDMLRTLDAELDLRAHYSDKKRDIIARMWFQDASIEWFHYHYLQRVSITYDDYSGVLRIKAQGYDSQTALAIASILVREGERYMNQIGHELAQVQVTFLQGEVSMAHKRLLQASQDLLDFQNTKGLASPKSTVESFHTIIAKLEAQRTEIETQIASLPASLNPNHPNRLMLKQALEAVERQIEQEKTKLASPYGQTLNYTVEEFLRLEKEVDFAQAVYQTALVGLEKGRMDATRTLKKVAVLQSPSLPEYPTEPRVLYNSLVTLLVGLLLAGMVKLLESIVLDHVD